MKSNFLTAILCGIALASCNEGPPKQSPADRGLVSSKDTAHSKVVVKDTVKATKKNDADTACFIRKFNDIARYIAGMKQEAGSEYADLEKDTVWIRHSKNFDKTWQLLESKRLKPMRDWSNTELAEQHKLNLDIFYPLSGPDILHANAFFSRAKHYHLYALERAGAMPDLKKMKPSGIATYLDDVYTSLGDVFTKSYFITHKMLTDLQRENVNGTLPLICVFLVRSNHKIINVKYYHLNDDGTDSPLNKDSAAIHTNDFVKVYFKSNDDSTMQVLSYMKCDLADGGLKINKGLTAFINNMPQSITYLKSASYLLHYKFFTTLRDAILNKSEAILEDDTGIPYKYFSKDKWTINLYGKYVTPVDNFSGVFQDDLLKAYQDTATQKPQKLPFSLGYHWGTNNQNLLKAERKG
jgi:hypothetical protein